MTSRTENRASGPGTCCRADRLQLQPSALLPPPPVLPSGSLPPPPLLPPSGVSLPPSGVPLPPVLPSS